MNQISLTLHDFLQGRHRFEVETSEFHDVVVAGRFSLFPSGWIRQHCNLAHLDKNLDIAMKTTKLSRCD